MTPEHREIHADLEQLELEEMLIWELEDGERFGSDHSIRNTMRAYAKRSGRRFAAIQRETKVYVIRWK